MHCPSCGHQSCKVIDSRIATNGRSIRRRRECDKCQFRFTTFERLQSSNFMIEKKDGRVEPYDREKLEGGILKSCTKRPISLEKIRQEISELEEKWGKDQIVLSEKIGEDAMQMLKNIDEVAFLRFASVYKDFDDLQKFSEYLKK